MSCRPIRDEARRKLLRQLIITFEVSETLITGLTRLQSLSTTLQLSLLPFDLLGKSNERRIWLQTAYNVGNFFWLLKLSKNIFQIIKFAHFLFKGEVVKLINVRRDFQTVTFIPVCHFYLFAPKLLIALEAIFDKEIAWMSR